MFAPQVMFAPGTILWCDSQQGIVCIAKTICITFQGWKPPSGYNNHSLEKGRGKSIPNNNFRVVIQVFITLLQGHLQNVAGNPQRSEFYINLSTCSCRKVTAIPNDTLPLSNPIIVSNF